jgi:hypothetical protein
MLPPIETELPRAKPLPKPKQATKWEQFAAAKGIQKKRRERKLWDEEKQEWVNRWGRGGKNKEAEEQWAVEVPANARASSSNTWGPSGLPWRYLRVTLMVSWLSVLYSERL